MAEPAPPNTGGGSNGGGSSSPANNNKRKAAVLVSNDDGIKVLCVLHQTTNLDLLWLRVVAACMHMPSATISGPS